jgi:DNA-binding response OmpR family regulator
LLTKSVQRELIVDDDILIQQLLKEELGEFAYQVSMASTGKERIFDLLKDSKNMGLI